MLTFGLGQSNVNLLCVYMGMSNYSPLTLTLCCDSGLIDFYTLMNPSEPWGNNDDGLRFLCCVACVPSVIPGTSANALHVSKVRRPPCAFEVPLVGC